MKNYDARMNKYLNLIMIFINISFTQSTQYTTKLVILL